MSDNVRVGVWDGWRGLAIILVLAGHFLPTSWIWEERMGVDVFFVLSGMLMSNILFEKRMYLKDFYIRRFSRVMPALTLFVCFAFGIAYLKPLDFHISEFFSSLLFLRAYYPADPFIVDTPVPVPHLWSLNVEEHSYLIMSLLTLLIACKRQAAIAFFCLYLVSVIICFHLYFTLPAAEFKKSLFRTETTIGFIMFSAAYCLIKQHLNIKLGPYTSAICLVLAAACYLQVAPIWLTFLVCPVLLGVGVNHLAESAKGLETLLLNWSVRKMGVISFSVYLWQQVFYMYSYVLPGGALTGFIASIVVGVASFYLFEDPVRKYINGRWSPRPRYKGNSDDTESSVSVSKRFRQVIR